MFPSRPSCLDWLDNVSTLKLGLLPSNEANFHKNEVVITFKLRKSLLSCWLMWGQLHKSLSVTAVRPSGQSWNAVKAQGALVRVQTVHLASCCSASPGVSRFMCSPCLSGYSVPDFSIISLSLFSALVFVDFWCVLGSVCSACWMIPGWFWPLFLPDLIW